MILTPNQKTHLIKKTMYSQKTHPIEKISNLLEQWNNAMTLSGRIEYKVPTEIDKAEMYAELEKFENEKAITGAGASTGLGLISNYYPQLQYVLNIAGGVYIASGAQYQDEVNGNAVFTGAANFGDFVALTSTLTTPTTSPNDIAGNNLGQTTVNLNQYYAEVPIFNTVAARYASNPGQLYGVFSSLLELKKLVNLDVLATTAIVLNAGVTATPVQVGPGPITSAMIQMIKITSKYQFRPKYYMNQAAFADFVNERNTFGDTIQKAYAQYSFTQVSGSSIANAGLVGYFGGYEIHLVPSIPSSCTVDVNNAVTAVTGGNKNVIIMGIPNDLGIIRGRAEFDTNTVFSPGNSLAAARTGQTIISASTQQGAGLINTASWSYYAY
jgi:hypothetical protein